MSRRAADSDAPIDLEAVEQELRAREAELSQRLERFAAAPERGSGLGFGKRVGDGTIEAVSRMTDAGVGEALEPAEARVKRALVKLEEGTYGVCDSCGEAIPTARLRFAPASVTCVSCARG
ncbi:TraR/DksA C4-type zinc finger protein [Paraconexibacter sp. AEG42_29]